MIHYLVKVRVSNRGTRLEEIRKSILVPADLKVVDLVKAFAAVGNVSGVFEIPDSFKRHTNERYSNSHGPRLEARH